MAGSVAVAGSVAALESCLKEFQSSLRWLRKMPVQLKPIHGMIAEEFPSTALLQKLPRESCLAAERLLEASLETQKWTTASDSPGVKILFKKVTEPV